MRERHWREVRIEVRDDFDERSPDFTLEKVFNLKLERHAKFLFDLAHNAQQELGIENQMKKIEYTWTEDPQTDLKTDPYHRKGDDSSCYKITTAENIYQVIEEHAVILSNNKSGPYYTQFEETIDKWEKHLNDISETLEMLMQVQAKWSYLESIFSPQGDIIKLLPTEHTTFGNVNNIVREEMERINSEKNALKCLTKKGFLPLLEEQDAKLEGIQKNLRNYLETKRTEFPRFYFLSDDDLLEIIGQNKEQGPIQKHIKKLFEGIQKLKFSPSPQGRKARSKRHAGRPRRRNEAGRRSSEPTHLRTGL